MIHGSMILNNLPQAKGKHRNRQTNLKPFESESKVTAL